jgi:DNA-binding CsgD family transcriptional regulator
MTKVRSDTPLKAEFWPAETQPALTPSAASTGSTVPANAWRVGDDTVVSRDVAVALTYGLELVRYGAMLVAPEGCPKLVNRTALSILKKKDGLSLERTGLVADRASDTRLLLKLLHEAIKTPEMGEPRESPLSLPRKKVSSSLVVRVFPGPGLGCWACADNRAALVMLYDHDLSLEVNVNALCRLYGLTRGEAALAAILVRGKSVEDAADELFISPHTARTHLKRIFMKTDTHRQTELVVRISPAFL